MKTETETETNTTTIPSTTVTINTINTVKQFYDANATAFSKTRNFPWPSTSTFLHSLPIGSYVLDVGCGNGRNMFERKDIHMTGLELSTELCKVVQSRGGNVVHGSMTSIPFPNQTFDVVMAIASYHHLSTDQERTQAIREFYRVLRPNGILYLHVWAMEQPSYSRRKFTKRDEIVPWKNNDGEMFYRYYHIYREGDLEKEITQIATCLKHHIQCERIEYDEGNWIGVFRKCYE